MEVRAQRERGACKRPLNGAPICPPSRLLGAFARGHRLRLIGDLLPRRQLDILSSLFRRRRRRQQQWPPPLAASGRPAWLSCALIYGRPTGPVALAARSNAVNFAYWRPDETRGQRRQEWRRLRRRRHHRQQGQILAARIIFGQKVDLLCRLAGGGSSLEPEGQTS